MISLSCVFGERSSCLVWGFYRASWSYGHRSSCLCAWSCVSQWLVPWMGTARCANWLLSLCYVGAVWVPGTPGCECDSLVCDLRTSTYCRAVVPWLVPWVGIGWSARMCLWPLCFVMVLCVSHELTSPKLKVLHSVRNIWCVAKLVLAWIWTLDMLWN